MQQMSDQALRERRAYQKKWRDNNPDKVRAKNARYWEKKARERAAKHEEETD